MKSFILPGSRLLLLVLPGFLLLSCEQEASQVQLDLLKRFETSASDTVELSSERIEELKDVIRTHGPEVEKKIMAAGKLSGAYTLLGAEYQRMGMHRLALEAYQAAIEISPANPRLLLDAAISAGQWAASAADPEVQQSHYELARFYYERLLTLEPFNKDGLYGLAVLLSFQFGEQDAAFSLLERLEAMSAMDSRALFLKARILVLQDRVSEAIAIYGDIASQASDPRERNQAALNQRELLGQ